jgi:hypothetical protein
LQTPANGVYFRWRAFYDTMKEEGRIKGKVTFEQMKDYLRKKLRKSGKPGWQDEW